MLDNLMFSTPCWLSLSARRAWIEIARRWQMTQTKTVALRKESVDRNWKQQGRRWWKFKSLSARRAWIEIPCARFKPIVKSVALRKESVDRNWLDSRRKQVAGVALRKESVDRNAFLADFVKLCAQSLSARRAWIESMMSSRLAMLCVVALRKESVDRNYRAHGAAHRALSRSPQGERG